MARTTIALAKGLSVPAVEFATEVSANIGNRGGGKSNGAAVAVEQALDAGVPVVVLDYVGIWASIRLERDGKTPSRYQIPLLGGPHGDIAIAATAGAVVAETLATRNSSAIIDLSLFNKGDRCRFATDFAEAFFQAKKRQPGPVLLVLEEAQRYIPQRIQPDQARMLGAFEEIAETGRNFGIGLLLISLRPQKLNKDVLNLADWVFAYRTNGKHEREALSDWMQEKGADDRADMADELPGLPKGTAIVWCPVRRIYGRYEVPLKQTFDASATPVRVRDSVKIQPLDLGELQAAMGRVSEDAKENDPRHLKAEIARLRKELAAKVPVGATVEKRIDVPVVPAEWVAEVRDATARLAHMKEQVLRELTEQVDCTAERFARMVHLGEKYKPAAPVVPRAPIPHKPSERSAPPRQAGGHASAEVGNGGLRRMLVALAQRPQGLTSRQLGVRAGMSSQSGTFANYLARARTQGWISDRGDVRLITDAGLQALGEFDPLPEGAELAAHWIREVGGGASRMLRAIVDAYPATLTYAELGERAGISHSSGTFANYLSRLRTLELVTGRGEVRASEELV